MGLAESSFVVTRWVNEAQEHKVTLATGGRPALAGRPRTPTGGCRLQPDGQRADGETKRNKGRPAARTAQRLIPRERCEGSSRGTRRVRLTMEGKAEVIATDCDGRSPGKRIRADSGH
jgi:hypothetical protein